MTKDEAVKEIAAKVNMISAKGPPDAARLSFCAEKMVLDIFSYCHIDDFPPPLVFAVADFLCRHFESQATAAKSAGLKSVQMNETRFEFDTQARAESEDISITPLKKYLNLYRKLTWI